MLDWLTDNSGSIITVGFSGAFTAILFWAYRPSNKSKLQEQAMIPFHEEQQNG